MTRVALLPMDDRPVNYDAPLYLGRAAGVEIELPPREWLGNPWRPSRHAALVEWLAAAAPQADGVIVALDTLGYGGLIPSRTSPEPAASVLARLGVLRAIQTRCPGRPILASSVVMRINRSNSSEEEKPYCATYGSRLFRLSFLEHKSEAGAASAAETVERDALRAEIPADVYRDYRAGRARNHAVNRAMLAWAEEGVFDFLILPQDDTADFGWNVAEAKSLQADIHARGLADRAITYPGADEIGCLLLARFVCRQAGWQPKVWSGYSTATGPSVVTAYEDRPLPALLRAHLTPLAGSVVAAPEEADVMLFINSPVDHQGNGDSQWLIRRGLEAVRPGLPAAQRPWLDSFFATEGFRRTQREMESPARRPDEFARALLAALDTGRPVALADVAFVNAADLALGEILRREPRITGLAAYGGWNTAGNTLGTVLAQAVIRAVAQRVGDPPARRAAHLEFLFLRFLDDDLYQAHERTRCLVEDLPELGLTPTMERLPEDKAGEVEARVRAHLERSAARLAELFCRSGAVRRVDVTRIHLPWGRLFEVGCDVRVALP